MKILITKQLFLLFLFLNPLALTLFVNEDDFVGVKEENYKWNTQFDKEPMEDMFMDMYDDEVLSEILTDEYFEFNGMREDSKQWEIVIKSVSAKFSDYYKGKEFSYVKLKYTLYEYREKDQVNTRHTIETKITYYLYEANYPFLAKFDLDFQQNIREGNSFFRAKNTNFEKLAKAINTEWGDVDYYDVSVVKVNMGLDIVGLKYIYINEDVEDLKDLIVIEKYNPDGVLYEKTMSYEDANIYKLELDGYIIILKENWILITLILIGTILIASLYLWIKFKMR